MTATPTRKLKHILLAAIVIAVVLFVSIRIAKPLIDRQEKPTAQSGYDYVLGVSLPNSTNPENIHLITQLNNILPTDSVNLIIKESQDEPAQQAKQIKELQNYGIDLLIVSPLDSASVYVALEEAKESLPLIILNQQSFADLADSYIAYDNNKGGALLAEQLRANPKLSEGLLLIAGPKGDVVSEARMAGLIEHLDLPHDKIETIYGTWIRNNAENAMKYYLVSGETCGIVVGLNDQMAYGASIGARKLLVDNVDFYGCNGFDGDHEGKELVSRKILKGTIAFEDMSQAIYDTALKILNKQDYPGEIILDARFWE